VTQIFAYIYLKYRLNDSLVLNKVAKLDELKAQVIITLLFNIRLLGLYIYIHTHTHTHTFIYTCAVLPCRGQVASSYLEL